MEMPLEGRIDQCLPQRRGKPASSSVLGEKEKKVVEE